MALETSAFDLMNRFFSEAVSTHGADLASVVRFVKTRIAALSAEDKSKVDRAFEIIIASGRDDEKTRKQKPDALMN